MKIAPHQEQFRVAGPLQAGRLQDLVTKHKKAPWAGTKCWCPGCRKTIVIQSWRGVDSLAARPRRWDIGAFFRTATTWNLGWSARRRHYAMDPLGGPAAALTPEQKENN